MKLAGAWRTYEFNVTGAAKAGSNVLAAQVGRPLGYQPGNHVCGLESRAADKSMGLWREVYAGE